ncbi:MAG: hypothetical protein E2O68_08795 [Deltaproteobacteria bacterium]|nr:MAG: hypothetical protein E2O68_08795 [Deltaproteobacteria bacterium]
MNRYLINGLVLFFWLTLALNNAWGSLRDGIERPIIEREETIVIKTSKPTKIEECSNVFNNLQRKEVNDSARRFPGAYYEERGNL